MKRIDSNGNLWLLGALALLLLQTAAASDWPQWRGVERNGHADESGLLQQWPEDGPRMIYSASGMGKGYSSLSLSEGLLFTMGDVDDAQYVIAVKASDGSAVWKTRVGPPWPDQYVGARSTPTVDGDRLYALGTEGDLVCLNKSDGREIWRRNLQRDFGGHLMIIQNTNWKYAESPLVDGDKVVVTPGGPQAAIVALDKMTGEEIWRSAVPNLGERGADGAGYSSIVISHGAGVKQYVQLMGRGVVGVEADSGRFLWGYNRVANDVANIATPLVQGDYVFASTGYRTGAALLKLVKNGDGVEAQEVYFLEAGTMQNHHGGMILQDGYIYTGTGHNKGFPLCVKMDSGEVAWGPVRNDGEGSAAVTYADGHLYMRYQNGLMVLVEATPEEYREKGSFMIPDVNQFSWSHPVISDGRLYLREQDRLLVYDISAD
ncbi:MAG TPA: PQQ-binding-like beta-propeller repeat protein [Acidobacteriota bacterium]|nr:PQQ-binding-like beta-propeller repeat protein [Acidobacteriota bacterium]